MAVAFSLQVPCPSKKIIVSSSSFEKRQRPREQDAPPGSPAAEILEKVQRELAEAGSSRSARRQALRRLVKRLHPDQNRGKDTVFWGKKSGGWGRYVFIVVFLRFFSFFCTYSLMYFLLKGCRPCRRPLTEETAKLGADGRNSGLVTADKFRGYSNPFVLMLTAARKLPKRCFWNLLKTKKKSRLKQSKPLRNVRLGSLQATRPNSRKRCLGRACEKAEPQQVLCPSHCETVAGKMPKRRCWNPLKRERNRAQTMRNRSQKTAETLLLDPTKNKNKEKTCKPPGQTQEKGVWDAHAKRQNPSRFCAQAIAKPQPEKCRNVAVGTH